MYSRGIEFGAIQLIGPGVPNGEKFWWKFGSSLSLAYTWCQSLLFLSISCKLPIKLASLSLSYSGSVSVSFPVSIEMSESDSDENPLWMFSWSPVEVQLAAMFFEYMASRFLIGKLRSTIRQINKTNRTRSTAFSQEVKPRSWLPVPNQLKYFTEYNDNDGIRPLCVRFPQMTGYVKKFEFNLTISFKISDKQLLKKYYPI